MLTRRRTLEQRADRSEEFASVTIDRPRARMATGLADRAPAKKPQTPKIERRAVQAIRDSARGEECTVRIPWACVGGTETTVLSHLPGLDGDRGMGLKALDVCSAYACAGCHDAVDGRSKRPDGVTHASVMLDWYAGHMRTLVRLAQKGLL